MQQIVLAQLHSSLLVVVALKMSSSSYSRKALIAQLLIKPFPQSLMKTNQLVVVLTASTMQ